MSGDLGKKKSLNLAILGLLLLPEKTLCIGSRLKSQFFSLKFGENLPVKKSLAQLLSLVLRFPLSRPL
jgi:hypothetical protein